MTREEFTNRWIGGQARFPRDGLTRADFFFDLAALIDAAVKAAVDKERERCARIVLRHATCTCGSKEPLRDIHGGGCLFETIDGLAAAIRSAAP
jgi:hypothetical protein